MKRLIPIFLLVLLLPSKSFAPPIGPGGIYGGGGATTMSELTDTATATTGQIMGFNGSAWAPTDQAGAAGGDPDQNLWDDVIPDTGVTVTAGSTTADLTITGDAGISTAGSNAGGIITISGDHDALPNFVAGEHFLQSAITTVGTVTVGDVDSVVSNADSVTVGKIEIATIAETNTGTSQTLCISPDGLTDWTGSTNVTTLGTIATGTWNGTDIAVPDGGTGAGTLTDGGVLLGSGTGAITPMAVLADSAMIVGDGTTDPVAESGATLRTSIGVAYATSAEVKTGTEAAKVVSPLTVRQSVNARNPWPRTAQWFTPTASDDNIYVWYATGGGVIDSINCYSTAGTTTILVTNGGSAVTDGGGLACATDAKTTDSTLANTTIAADNLISIDTSAIAGAPTKIFVQINYHDTD